MKKTIFEYYKQFEIYKVTDSKKYPDGTIWITTDEDLEYYIDPIKGYCKTIEDAKRIIDIVWERNY